MSVRSLQVVVFTAFFFFAVSSAFLLPASAPSLSRPTSGRSTKRYASTVEISPKTGEGAQGGRATTFRERSWNASTMGALPTDLASFAREGDLPQKPSLTGIMPVGYGGAASWWQISDCVLTGMANGELGLTVTAGGEFSPDNKFYSPQKLAALVMQLSAKLSVLGQTKVLFSGPGMLLTALEHMSEIAAIEAKRDQEERGVVAAVRRQVQAKYPGAVIPEVPATIARELEQRAKEKARLALNVQWGSLLGPFEEKAVVSGEQAIAAVLSELDLDNDRMYLVVAPGNSPAEVLAVRKLIKVAGKRPVIILNHRFTPLPLEMSVFTEAFHLEMRKIKTSREEPSVPLPSRLDEWASPARFGSKDVGAAQELTETCLLRKFPYPWQVFGDFKAGEGFELVDSFFSRPSQDEIRSRITTVVQQRRTYL